MRYFIDHVYLFEMKRHILLYFILIIFIPIAPSQSTIGSWGDQGNGTYINPILNADYSDPDVVRVDDRYYMVCSEFHYMGMPVLESNDMVNWRIVAQIYPRLDFPAYDNVESYANGSWAPSIRYHDNRFWVYFCTPTEGLFMSSAEKAEGPWSPLLLVRAVEKWEDPCPLWDDDGNAYLAHSLHGAGPIILHRMSSDGTALLDDGYTVYTGPVAEGPKMFKRNGYYYISIPEGGVTEGWQTVLRSKNIYGHYEKKVVLETGSTSINGPHQGAFVNTPEGEDWFYHFQSDGPMGRVVHLQPVRWQEDWPVVGVDIDRNGVGEPVYVWKKPDTGILSSIYAPQTDDDFDTPRLGLQWQFNHNPVDDAWSLTSHPGYLSLTALKGESFLRAKNSVTQKIMGKSGEAVTALNLTKMVKGQKTGLASFGSMYNLIGVIAEEDGNSLFFESNQDLFDASHRLPGARIRVNYFNTDSNYQEKIPFHGDVVYFKMQYNFNTQENRFYYSSDNIHFIPFGRAFDAIFSFWKGARIALFSYNEREDGGIALFDWFRYEYDGPKEKVRSQMSGR